MSASKPQKERVRGRDEPTHGRHCRCSACAREDWTQPHLAPCGMHGSSCPPVYDPWPKPESNQHSARVEAILAALMEHEAEYGHDDSAIESLQSLVEQLEAAERLIGALATLGYNVELAQARKLVGAFPASSPVATLPVCPECAEGRHVYCLDDGSSTWTDKCRCTCREESSPASEPKEGA